MASLSSDEFDHSIPENTYECLSIIIPNNGKPNEVYVNCPLCKHSGKSFYCVECVRNGNFVHSKKSSLERFAEKKMTKYKLDDEKAQLLLRFESSFSEKKRKENMKMEIYKTKEKIRLLEASLKSYKETIIKDREKIEELKRDSVILESNRTCCISKLSDMEKRRKIKGMELEKANVNLFTTQSALQNCIQCRINELITHIFPITKVSSQSHKSSSSDENQFAELEEAQKTTYVRGQWVMTGGDMDDFQYSVIEPCIPNNGDYSAYATWCAEQIQGISRDNLSVIDKRQFDKAYGISAALAYTAQLVGILAFYIDAHVPKKCSFSDFCGHESSRIKFFHKVAKLNTNIVSLCLIRGVDVSEINAYQTIHNLLLLLKSETRELRRKNSSDVELMESIEDSLSKDLLSVDESDSDDLEAEYVHLSEEEEFLQVPDQAAIDPVPPPAQTSLMSSVFSLFRAAAGQK